MIPVLLLPAGMLATGGYLFQHLRGQRCRQARQRLATLADIRALRQLLETIPQHRGMANAFLQGDASFGAKLQAQQQRVDDDARILGRLAEQPLCRAVNARIQRIEAQWSDIKGKLQRLSATRSFALHSELTSEVLYLINDLAEGGGLLDGDSGFTQLADAAINLLPLVTETQGQARGMATGAAAQQECGIPQQVKLRYLLARTRDATGRAKEELQGQTEARALDDSLVATEDFLQLLETRILETAHIDIPPEQVFAAGTRAIDRSFALLDQLLDALQGRLAADARRCQRQWRLAQITATGLLAPAAWLVQLAL
ncbi:MAG TPA: hypothetical protein ENK51_06940 [Gammaproteobacteria bacterium]|nr:hypothetical protein [Gammaproteobacteria bacterium]